MITLDYVVRTKPEPGTNLASVDESSLHYDLFLGDITLLVNDVDMSARWGWIPIVDFAVCFDRIARELAPGEADSFEFTESEDRIDFKRENEHMLMEATYADGRASLSVEELRVGTRDFLRRVLDELMQ